MKKFFLFLALITLTPACSLVASPPPTPTVTPCSAIHKLFWPPRDLAVTPEGHIWAVGEDGAWWLDPTSGACALFTEENGPAEEFLSAVAVDLNGDVWMGGWWSGAISRFDGRRWTTYTDYQGDIRTIGLSDIAVAPDGTLWIGFPDYAYHFDGQEWTLYTENDGIPGGGVTAIAAAPDGTVWFGAIASRGDRGGIARFDGETWVTYTESDGLVDNNIEVLAVSADNAVWAGSKSGVSRFDGQHWATYTKEDGLISEHIMDIATGPDGSVWIATAEGIARFDGAHWTAYTRRDGLLSDFVSAIAVSTSGEVWAGMEGGIARFDGQHWITYRIGRDFPTPGSTTP